MDKYTNSVWFSRLVALAIAALLFTSVNFESKNENGSLGFNTPGKVSQEVIEDVPVEIDYDQENLVVTGAPETVKITLEGVKSLLIPAKTQREFQVYIDLSDPEITLGEKKVPLKIRNLNEKLTATLSPAYATVMVQEKVTKEFSVDVDYNRSLLEEGYTAENPTSNPQTVKITGAKDVINQISFVKATLGLEKGLDESVNREATVKALDRDLNKLNVTIEPAVVNVSLKVNIPSKTVPIRPIQSGKLKSGLKIKSLTTDDKEVTIYGKESILENINEVTVPVNISNITGDAVYELPISVPDGVKKVSKDTVKVNIKTEKADPDSESDTDTDTDSEASVPEDTNDKDKPVDKPTEDKDTGKDEDVSIQTKKFSNLKIQTVGLDNDRSMKFINPSMGSMGITFKGTRAELNKLKEANIQLSVNVNQLEAGTHDVAVQVKAPDKTNWELDSRMVTISITDNEEETS